jgi:hypothetical protein
MGPNLGIPTDAELIFWTVGGVIALIFLLAVFIIGPRSN